MNISKKALLIGLITISFIVTIFFYYSSNIKLEKNHEKIFTESNDQANLREITLFKFNFNSF